RYTRLVAWLSAATAAQLLAELGLGQLLALAQLPHGGAEVHQPRVLLLEPLLRGAVAATLRAGGAVAHRRSPPREIHAVVSQSIMSHIAANVGVSTIGGGFNATSSRSTSSASRISRYLPSLASRWMAVIRRAYSEKVTGSPSRASASPTRSPCLLGSSPCA